MSIYRFSEWKNQAVHFDQLEGYKDQAKPSHCSTCGHPGM